MVRSLHTPVVVFLVGMLLPVLLSAQTVKRGEELYIPPTLTLSVGNASPLYYAYVYGSDPTRSRFETREERRFVVYMYPEWKIIPVLPMIFFDQGSSAIQLSYQTFLSPARARDYNVQGVSEIDPSLGKWGKYYEILNIIGCRMAADTSLRLELIGGYSAEPGETPSVALDRSRTVQHYLRDIWKIDTARLTIRPPEQMADREDNRMVQEEGRRVVFLSNDPSLFSDVSYYVQTPRFSRYALFADINPNVEPDRVAGMTLNILCDTRVIGSTDIPPSSDSSLYRVAALWALPQAFQEEDFRLSAEVIMEMKDGPSRISAQVPLQVVVKMNEPMADPYGRLSPEERTVIVRGAVGNIRNSDRELNGFAVNFFSPGDTLLQEWQRTSWKKDVENVYLRDNVTLQSGPSSHVIYSDPDYSDIPNLDPAEIADLLGRQSSHDFSDKVKKRSEFIPILLLPQLSATFREELKQSTTLQNERIRELTEILGGSTSDMEGAAEREKGFYRMSSEQQVQLRTVLRARHHHLATLLQRDLHVVNVDSAWYSELEDLDQLRTTESPRTLPVNYTPVDRMYRRRAVVAQPR